MNPKYLFTIIGLFYSFSILAGLADDLNKELCSDYANRGGIESCQLVTVPSEVLPQTLVCTGSITAEHDCTFVLNINKTSEVHVACGEDAANGVVNTLSLGASSFSAAAIVTDKEGGVHIVSGFKNYTRLENSIFSFEIVESMDQSNKPQVKLVIGDTQVDDFKCL